MDKILRIKDFIAVDDQDNQIIIEVWQNFHYIQHFNENHYIPGFKILKANNSPVSRMSKGMYKILESNITLKSTDPKAE